MRTVTRCSSCLDSIAGVAAAVPHCSPTTSAPVRPATRAVVFRQQRTQLEFSGRLVFQRHEANGSLHERRWPHAPVRRLARTFETVFDVRDRFGSDKYHLADALEQRRSRPFGNAPPGWLVRNARLRGLRRVRRAFAFYTKKGDFDECQVDKSGRWLVIKENVDGRHGEDNLIIDLQSGEERLLIDSNGAAGHSDVGFGSMIAEDNFNSLPGAVRRWDFSMDVTGGQPATVRGQGELVYQLSSWTSGSVTSPSEALNRGRPLPIRRPV